MQQMYVSARDWRRAMHAPVSVVSLAGIAFLAYQGDAVAVVQGEASTSMGVPLRAACHRLRHGPIHGQRGAW